MRVIDKDFSDGNIKFTVEISYNESIESGIRMVEVFNDNFREGVTYLRPIGFKINGFGTENQLYASEDFTETIIEIVRKLDKYSYRFVSKSNESICNYDNIVPSFRTKMVFNKPTVLISDIMSNLSEYGIENKSIYSDEVLIHNLKDSITLEFVFGLCTRNLTPDEASAVCKFKNGTDHYICNVATIGGIVYALDGDSVIKVDCDVFVSDPENLYSATVDKIKATLANF